MSCLLQTSSHLFYSILSTCRVSHLEVNHKRFTVNGNYSAIPCFRADPLRSSCMQLCMSDCSLTQRCLVVTWLVPRETTAVSACSVYTIQPCTSFQCHCIRSHIRRVHFVFSCNLPPAFLSISAPAKNCHLLSETSGVTSYGSGLRKDVVNEGGRWRGVGGGAEVTYGKLGRGGGERKTLNRDQQKRCCIYHTHSLHQTATVHAGCKF